MWPVLLNMTRDECRLTLRRLELEAYSNMIDVFRAQGSLEDSRKKLLEELRAVLHISQDRHSAEARRVSNDQLLATIAEKLSGPNTNLGWILEGRRRIPLLPRGVAQTAYTEIADKAAEQAAAENKELQKRLAAEKLVQKPSEEEVEHEDDTVEAGSNEVDEMYPIAMEDPSIKLWETELINRKRKITETSTGDDASTPVKNMRNIPVNPNQKHVNLSQIYSKFSQPVSSKPAGQSKHSYNQVSKVSTSKSSQGATPRGPRATPHKQKPHKPKPTPKQPRKRKEPAGQSPSQKQYNPTSVEYSGPPNTFQASYAQAVLGGKIKPEYPDEMKPKVISSPSMAADLPTMQLLTQPPAVPHDLEISENAHPDDPFSLQSQSTPVSKQTVSGKPCQLILQNRGEIVEKKHQQKSEVKVQKQPETIKLLSSRQAVVVAPSSAPKVVSSTPGKLVTTKVIGSIPKSRPSNTPAKSDKMIVLSKSTPDHKNMQNTKLIVTSGANSSSKERTISTNTHVPRIVETLTPKGIPATDLKVSAKAVVLNPKSGQKMVVVPAKSRTKQVNEGQIPLIHFKGIPTAMKLVPMGSQSMQHVGKPSSAPTVVSKPSTIPSNTKIIGMEPIKTANLADIVPVKGMTPVSSSKITNPIVRPSSAKGNVIVVQKATNLGKALTFAKNGNDMSKIIMGKNVTQLLQASKTEHTDVAKSTGNVIVLELNNEQSGRATTMSEILDSRGSSTTRLSGDKKAPQITQDTPVLFDNQMTEETCNANSLDSTVGSISGIVPMEDTSLSIISKEEAKSTYSKDSDGAKDSSSVTDWEMELDTVTRKDKDDDDKLNSMHLDLGMSSDSDNEYMATGRKKSKHVSQEIQRATTSGESGEMFTGSGVMSLATRTLLSQLQDEGSSSNDSSFALRAKIIEKRKEGDGKLAENDELTKAKEKLFEKVADAKSQQKRIDIYSTAITTTDINLDSFAYLEESMMAGDECEPRSDALAEQLARLLAAGDSPRSHDSHSHSVSESMPLNK